MPQRARPFVANIEVGFRCAAALPRERRCALSAATVATAHTAIAAHERRGVAEKPHGLAASPGSPELPSAISDVAHEAVAPGALDRRAGETRAEGGVVEPRRARRAAAPRDSSRCTSRASRPACGELVPGADREAVVAAEDAVADAFAQLRRDGPLVLDRQVGDAAPRIEAVGRRKGVRRADVEAAPAGAAAVGLGRRRAAAPRSVKIAPRKSQLPNSRETRMVCLPCQPSPAAAASGFSITGAVSTNTFTSPPPCAARKPASSLSLPLMTS